MVTKKKAPPKKMSEAQSKDAAKRNSKAIQSLGKPERVNKRAVPVTTTLADAIEDGYSRLSSLKDEVQEIVDNAPEALQDSDRIQTLEQTCSSLDGVDSTPDVPLGVADMTVKYTEDQRKSRSHSRASQCAEACDVLRAAVEAMDEWIEDADDRKDGKMSPAEQQEQDEELEEVKSLRDEVQDMLDNAEGCEWPGMYG